MEPACKKPRLETSSAKTGIKRKNSGSEEKPLPQKRKVAVANRECVCFIVKVSGNGHSRATLWFNPLDVAGQQRACKVLKLKPPKKNVVSGGGVDVPLTVPDTSTLLDTVGDGSYMFRAMCFVMTGYQRQQVAVRRAIVKHLCDNEPL